MIRTRFAIAAVFLSLSALGFPVPSSATVEPCEAPALEGTWSVVVTLAAAPPGFANPFTALETYSRGCGLVTTNALPAVPRPGQGDWLQQQPGNRFRTVIAFFTFEDPDHPGSVVVTHRIRILRRGVYAGQGEAEFFDAAGNSLALVPFTSAGTRLSALPNS